MITEEKSKKTILVIDDSKQSLDIITHILQDNYSVITTTDCHNLIRIFNKTIPDLILLDVIMPKISGYEVMREIRLIDPLSHIPVLFLTAIDDEESQLQGLDLGALDYVTKPFNPKILKAKIKNYISLKSHLSKLEKTVQTKNIEILHNKVHNLLNNVDQGILSFGLDLLIEDGYSRKVTDFFKTDLIHKKNIIDLICKNNIEQKKLFQKAFMLISQTQDDDTILMYLSLLPKELLINGKYLKFEYKIIGDKKFMLIIEDVTAEKELEKQLKLKDQTQKMIVSIASNREEFLDLKEDFENFHKSISLKIDDNNNCLVFLRMLHTFKGLFAQKEMQQVVQQIHQLESNIKVSIQSGPCDKSDILEQVRKTKIFDAFYDDLQNISNILGESYFDSAGKNYRLNIIKKLEDKIKYILSHDIVIDKDAMKNILDDILRLNTVPLYTQFISYPSLVAKTAEKLHKKIYTMSVQGDHSLLVPSSFKSFTKTLIHVYRNCVDHGIEDPDTRAIFYKDEYGTIATSFYKDNQNNVVIEISDDGAGIDYQKLENKCIENKLLTKEQIDSMSEEEISSYIFHDNISTKDNVTEISGRGLGLAAVKKELENFQGTYKVENNPIYGVKFIFTLPLSSYLKKSTEFEIIVQKAVEFFKDSLFLDILSIKELHTLENYTDIIALNFENQLEAVTFIQIEKKLLDHLASVMIPSGFSNEEIQSMLMDIPKEIINTYAGLAINDLKQLDLHKIGISVPFLLKEESFEKMKATHNCLEIKKVTTNYGSFYCGLINNKILEKG